MELTLIRTYYRNGTNGRLMHGRRLICYTIELPWLDNQRGTSCIPEGRYELRKRQSVRHGEHIWLPRVPGRTWILFHPANDALKELNGCIAPVSLITAPGRGINSRVAFLRLRQLVYTAIDQGEAVFITIKTR